jgi:tetratricopeptide (TPR) repeat protein
MNDSQLDLKIMAAARRLTDLQRQLLQRLKDKGPGLLLELAVRVLKFPEDVQAPLRELLANGLVERHSVSGGQFGSEYYTLSAAGERVLILLNDPNFQQEPQVAALTPSDPRREEIDLLNKMGDLAKEKGNLDEAMDFYKQALDLTRELTASGG